MRCVEVVEGKGDRIRWKCDHCKEFIFNGGQYRAAAARIHLAAKTTNGTCSKLCTAEDEHAIARQLKFQKLIDKLKKGKTDRARKRKQQAIRAKEAEVQIIENAKKKKEDSSYLA